MGSVRKIGSTWFGRWTDETGKRIERALQAETSRDAKNEVAINEKRARDVRRGFSDGTVDLTVAEVHARYEPVYMKQAAAKTKVGRFKRILKAFGDRKLRQVRPADIERFMADLADKGLAPQTVEHHRIALASLYTFAIKKERVFAGPNPAQLAEKVRVPQRPPRFIEARHVRSVIDQVTTEWRNLFALAVYTGLRAGELRGLRAQDVDRERRIIWVWRSNVRDTTKGGKMRVVPLPAEAMLYVEDQVKKQRSQWLFSRPNGQQLSATTKMVPILKRALVKAGLVEGYELRCVTRGQRKACGREPERRATADRTPCPGCGRPMWASPVPMRLTFHDLRKTHGTALYEASGDLRVVQRIHGHSDPRLTDRTYVGVTAERLVEQADKLTFKRASPVLPQNTAELSGSGEETAEQRGGIEQ